MTEKYVEGYIPPGENHRHNGIDSQYTYYVVIGFGREDTIKADCIKSKRTALRHAKTYANMNLAVFVRQCRFSRRTEDVRLGLLGLTEYVAQLGNRDKEFGSITTQLLDTDKSKFERMAAVRAAKKERRNNE